MGAVWEEPNEIAELLESMIIHAWPGRAYFIEVGQENRWVQIYQPWWRLK